ncbi:hypothetical protein EDC45_0756 [Mesocricetibacter intestinalis]|uniref:Lipoprotein n=1 Tax=Mesocricetibacter intestinalis TaxID=1521930 RepID=A0A4R6VDZ3_9PAST|nr:hypothetical protein [Mesocricetibacter intestinalis]TDQ58964.1 hypothetical protein EDC45_0756 [Mesocricetibacter intestinalis]
MKITHCCAAIFASLLLSACTQIQLFDTDKTFDENVPADKSARVKFTTDNADVFVLPGSGCLTINDTIVKAVESGARMKRADAKYLWGTFMITPPPQKEFNHKSINMVNIPLEDYQKKYGVKLADHTYISREYRLEAEKPYTIFIKTIGKKYAILRQLFENSENIYGFALTFMPESGRDYQVIMTEHLTNVNSIYNESYYTYSGAIFDITEPEKVRRLNYPKLLRTYSCRSN